jgi:hypothetical protein
MRKVQSKSARALGRGANTVDLVQQGLELIGLRILEGRVRGQHSFTSGKPSSRCLVSNTPHELFVPCAGRDLPEPGKNILGRGPAGSRGHSCVASEIDTDSTQLSLKRQMLGCLKLHFFTILSACA